jgi:hypothetical protein
MNVKKENNDNDNNNDYNFDNDSNSDDSNSDNDNKGYLNVPLAKKAISLSGSKFAKQKSIISLNDSEENEEKMEL